VANDVTNQQRRILHCALHGSPSIDFLSTMLQRSATRFVYQETA
jgi:hypothetical protein